MSFFLYRTGDGNSGNYPRFIVEFSEGQDPYAGLAALVASDYFEGHPTRAYVVENLEIDGEAEFGIMATVYEGPEGEQSFGAAWRTAELQPMTQAEAEGSRYEVHPFLECLDASALSQYETAAE